MEPSLPAKIRKEIDDLQTMREQLRLQLHLGSAELKKRWDHVETRWPEIESRLRLVGDKAEEAFEAQRALLQEIRSAYQDLRKRLSERPAK
jgi:hypothetical protein